MAKFRLLDRFSRTSSEEIKNLIEALFQQGEINSNCMGELLDIKSYLEGSEYKSSEIIEKWKEGQKALKSNDRENICDSITNLEKEIENELGLKNWAKNIKNIEKELKENPKKFRIIEEETENWAKNIKYVFSWPVLRLAFVDCPALSVPKLPVSS
jgi:predicted O-linked N-acetylglucosamine transferase (SPINDLY family)